MKSRIYAWLQQSVQIPIWLVLLGLGIELLAPDSVSKYGQSLVMLFISFQFLRSQDVGPIWGRINQVSRWTMMGLWCLGVIWRLYVGH